ncbi:metallophos domain-containing protein [Citrus sinensis]|uniref:Metallophos domain-containing protein n=1 Tax=Citrus sinensis TaxID=2711 RepID=A0ACB8J8Q5_CITSI|nr:metallophos domain-containing protein [Citrus sinensis]
MNIPCTLTSGWVIALALMHRVQMGVIFVQMFYLQLAGKYISLEGRWKSLNPCFYCDFDRCGVVHALGTYVTESTTLSNIYPLRHRIRGIPRLVLATATARDGGAILVFGRRVERSSALGKGGNNMMKQHHKLTLFLCLTWTITLLYGEMVAFWIPTLRSCTWPSSSSMDGVDGYDKVAVIADPQVISLPLPSFAAMLIVRRYEKEFGKRNYRFTVGKVEFIVVDAQTLDGYPEGNLAAATWDFVKNVSIDFQLLPRVLLTHIPLYRRDETPCGPHRSSPIINQRIVRTGHSQEILYQNYITEESSNRLLDLIKPVLVLSGHDHDQCTVSHESNHEHIKEHTVGTISWQQGNLYPSFRLLSASNSALLNMSNLEEAVLTRLCFLPMQTHIYIGYLLLFIVTLVTLLFWPTGGVNFGCHCSDFLAHGKQLFKVGTKEKTEDENCEYEMVWDAEGSMHLVRKATNTPITRAKDTSGTMERGNAVMRHTAKKGNAQEVEISMNVDDPMTNLPPRTSKSTAKFIIHRLVRMFRMLTVIAVVNIPLYMMLLFKDWIDQ